MRKLRIQRIAVFMLLSFIALAARSQVTIGDGIAPQPYSVLEISTESTKGGLRLPQLTTQQRNDLDMASLVANKEKGEGLAIFNLDTKCYEYWNSTRWISLCTGTANIIVTDEDGKEVDLQGILFPCEGKTEGPFIPFEIPPCTGKNSPYSFVVTSGAAYASISVIDETTGRFTVTMSQSNSAIPRTAVVRITNNCSGEFREFIITQDACNSLCDNTVAKPQIEVSNGGILCQSGAVYMHITNAQPGATYIWTLYDVYMGTGSTFIATQTGDYKVYVGGIGCLQNASDKITVKMSNTSAPTNPVSLSVGNGGVICSDAKINLMAHNVPSYGTLTWYKDGIKTTRSDNPLVLQAGDQGQWFAVIEEGSCTSKPTNAVDITYDTSSSSLAEPVIYVNGNNLTSVNTFCRNGNLSFTLNNYAAYTTAVTVSWYSGSVFLGNGQAISVTAPASGTFTLRCVVRDNTSQYCSAEKIVIKNIDGIAPKSLGISASSTLACNGNTVTLTANILTRGIYTFQWYKDEVAITGAEGQSYTTGEAGSYQVRIIEGGCQSPLSAATVVTTGYTPVATWASGPDAITENTPTQYSVSATNLPTQYEWSVTGGNITSGQGTATAGITFTAAGTAVVTLRAGNSCGSTTITRNVAVNAACVGVGDVTASMNLTGTQTSGQTLTMTATAGAGSTPFTYQWKKNNVDIPGDEAKFQTYIVPSADATHSGTYSCIVKNTCTPQGIGVTAGTVSFIDVNGIDPGTGSLSGRVCFDVALSNDNINGCAPLSSRLSQKADFTQTATNTQTYTFTPTGTVSNVRFYYKNTNGYVITSITGGNSGTNITTAVSATAIYDIGLNAAAKGLTRNLALTAEIYVVYNSGAINNGTDKMIKLTAKVQDCACCGAFNTSGEWLNFMCHNLGANEALDPFVYVSNGDAVSNDIKGDLYQWGRKADGHEKRNSATAAGPVYTLDADGQLTGPAADKFIYSSTYADWRSPQQDNLWGDGSNGNVNHPKAKNDPCPTGWKIPSWRQWVSIFSAATGGTSAEATANTWTWTGNGYMVGNALYLPGAGQRNYRNGEIWYVGGGWYWTTDGGSNGFSSSWFFGVNHVGSVGVQRFDNNSRSVGQSIRCIEDK